MVAGSSSAGASSFDVAVARFEADGDVDNTFSGNGFELTEITDFDGARDVALQRNGRIVAAGFADLGGANDFALVRYLTNGMPDGSFGVTAR